jgi:preprotein translocase subunit SecA
MQRLKMPEGEAIESPLLSRVIENASVKRSAQLRYPQGIRYDDVIDDQRRVIYQQRNELLSLKISPTPFVLC